MISLFDIKRILTPEKSTMPSDDFRIISHGQNMMKHLEKIRKIKI